VRTDRSLVPSHASLGIGISLIGGQRCKTSEAGAHDGSAEGGSKVSGVLEKEKGGM
jgi:hypothetical protein